MTFLDFLVVLLSLTSCSGEFELIRPRLQERHVVVLTVPDALRRNPIPGLFLSPDGTLTDCRGRPIDFQKVGGLMKANRDGSPKIVELVLDNEDATTTETLYRAIHELEKGGDTPLSDLTRGPAQAIVFVYLRRLDRMECWYRIASVFPGPLSKMPGLSE
jgi:hypothetical protein